MIPGRHGVVDMHSPSRVLLRGHGLQVLQVCTCNSRYTVHNIALSLPTDDTCHSLEAYRTRAKQGRWRVRIARSPPVPEVWDSGFPADQEAPSVGLSRHPLANNVGWIPWAA